MQLGGDVKSNLYVISYRDTNPEQATKVVQSLVSIFVESSLGDKRQDTRSAVRFVDDQLRQYEANLKSAEDRLKVFRLKYLGIAGQGSQDYFGRLSKLSDDIDNLRRTPTWARLVVKYFGEAAPEILRKARQE